MRMSGDLKRLALGGLLSIVVSNVASAGKFCGDPVESGLSTGTTQEEALLAAQNWWSSRAGALGRGYERWDNADEQSLECGKNDKGEFQCKAYGRPCLPEGTLPQDVPKLDM